MFFELALHYPRHLGPLAFHVKEPRLPELTRCFLYEQLTGNLGDEIDLALLPEVSSKVDVYHSAVAMFYAPSDNAGIRGMHCERIRSTPLWYGHPRHDTVTVILDQNIPGFRGMSAARALLFFSFRYKDSEYPCALVHWYDTYRAHPDAKTGMWIVRPAYQDARQLRPNLAVIHLDTLVRGVHLIPVYGSQPVPLKLKHYQTLDLYTAFYVNKLADYHANEILF